MWSNQHFPRMSQVNQLLEDAISILPQNERNIKAFLVVVNYTFPQKYYECNGKNQLLSIMNQDNFALGVFGCLLIRKWAGRYVKLYICWQIYLEGRLGEISPLVGLLLYGPFQLLSPLWVMIERLRIIYSASSVSSNPLGKQRAQIAVPGALSVRHRQEFVVLDV